MSRIAAAMCFTGLATCLAFGQSITPDQSTYRIQAYGLNKSGDSPPFRNIPPGKPTIRKHRELNRIDIAGPRNVVTDQATQSSMTALNPASTSTNFEGVDVSTYNPLVMPPDPNLAVGPNHVVQTVNIQMAIYSKSGVIEPGFPKGTNLLWTGFGGACETHNDGDPIVRYDRMADRWLVSQLTFDTSINNFHVCLAVSKTGDPGGAYWLYDVDFGNRLQDYPKWAVWTDGYYMSSNSFLPFGGGYLGEGSNLCAWQRDKLLVGDTSAKVICVLTFFVSGFIPADWDGATPPPAGSPAMFLNISSTSRLSMMRMTPDYVNTGSTAVTGPYNIAVDTFNRPCTNGGDCIPQKDTTQLLASIGDRLMYRLAYRNFGSHESLTVNHSVATNGVVGVRWYEIRDPFGTPAVYQQGTFAPDLNHRWMGSVAMDKNGNLAVGYSKSGPTMNPEIYFTGRAASDPLNTLGTETLLYSGGGSQYGNHPAANRWGDYSSIETDPVDDCTFWFTTEYIPSDGIFNWRTRIASFKFPDCGGAVKTPTTTTISSITPEPSVVGQQYTVAYSVTGSGGTPTGNVTVSDGAATNTCTVAAGACPLTSTTQGAKTITANYAGDSTFNGSSDTEAHTVNKASTTTTITSDTPDPSVVGAGYTVSWNVTVNAPGSGTPTGNVTVSDGTVSCAAAAVAGGCSLASTSAGAKTLTATYAGDTNFNTSSGTTAHTVNKANTTTTITSDTPDPSEAGSPYTVSWIVAVTAPGSGTPTGNVTVSDGTVGCSAAVAAGSCLLTSISSGAKTLTATYAGDSNFNSSSGTEPHSVNVSATVPNAPTNLTVQVTTSGNGKKVNYTANLSWKDNSDNEDNFILQRFKWTGRKNQQTCSLETEITLPLNTTLYVDSGMSSSTCKYAVAARNSAGTSAFAEAPIP